MRVRVEYDENNEHGTCECEGSMYACNEYAQRVVDDLNSRHVRIESVRFEK